MPEIVGPNGHAYMTPELLAEADRLRREEGMRWNAIARKLNVHPPSLKAQIYKWRQGKVTGNKRHGWAQTRAAMFSEIEAGVPVSEVAAKAGKSRPAAVYILDYHGYDAEVRRLYAHGGHNEAVS